MWQGERFGSATWCDARTFHFMWEWQQTSRTGSRSITGGVGAKFTSKRRPVELIWWQEFPDQKAARSRERELKGWRREKKLNLAREFAEARTLQPQKARLQGESPKVGDSGESSNG